MDKKEGHPALVRQLAAIFRYIAAEHDAPGGGDELLFELLHAGWFGIPAVEIAGLSVEVAGRQYSEKKTSIRRLLHEKRNMPPADLFTPPFPEHLRHAADLTEKWIREATSLPLPALFDSILRDTGMETWVRPEAGTTGEGQSLLALAGFIEAENDIPFTTQAPAIEKPEPGFIQPLVARFTMNVSALNNYLRCPLEFYYKNILRIPSPKNEAAEFGSAVHYALEQLFRKMLDMPGAGRQRSFASPEALVADFEAYMQSHREGFTAAQFERRLAYGREILHNYYAAYAHRFPTIVTIERMISVVYDGVPLKGKPDKLEFDGKLVNIVDYKTGDPDKAMARIQPPGGQTPNGGDYWRQAVFYTLLVNNYAQKGWKAASAEFDFIEPDSNKRYRREKLLISAPDIATVTQQITTSWQKIQNHEFYTGCGKTGCHWCNFAKTYFKG